MRCWWLGHLWMVKLRRDPDTGIWRLYLECRRCLKATPGWETA